MENETYLGQTYQVIRHLGDGGNASVYLVLHRRNMQLFAMKEIPLGGKTWDSVEKNYIRHLRHPGLPKVQDLFEENGCAYLVMDYINGKNLKEHAKEKGRLQEKELLDYFIQLMEILVYLHSRSQTIVHGDIKPANLMLDQDQRLVLVDFGAALPGGQKCKKWQGTHIYASPEQLACQEDIDGRSDLYSAGRTFLVLGGEKLSRGFQKILNRCTELEPDRRYASASTAERAAVRYRKRERRHALICCLLALLGMLTGTMYSLCRQKENKEQQYQDWIQSHQLSYLLSAVKSFPSREEAYHSILQLYLADEQFTREESCELERIILENKEAFSKKQEAYYAFCYEMGIAYWYYYSASGGKNYAILWFEQAATGIRLKEKKQWAEFYQNLGRYYAGKARQQRTGEELVSWRDFWELLQKAKIWKQEDGSTAELRKRLQAEIFAQLYDLLPMLKKENIGQQEIEQLLEQIRELYPEGLEEELQLAKDSLNTLYGKEEE